MNDATHVIFNGDTYAYIKKCQRKWFIDLGNGWESVDKWDLINVYWCFGWKINIYGMVHKLVRINK